MRLSPPFHRAICLGMILAIPLIAMRAFSPGPATAAGETGTAVAMGESAITKDAPSAREAAVAQGLLAALEKTALEILPIDRLTASFETIGPLLSAHRKEFIQDYKVLKESSDGKTYRVLVQATVSHARLKQALMGTGETAAQGETPPAVLLMISEQPAGEAAAHCWWQGGAIPSQPDAAAGALKQVLTENGFTVIDEKTLPLTQLGDLRLTAEPTDAQIIETGKRAKADMVIAGTAVAVETSNRMGEAMQTFKGTVTARPMMVETGEPLSTAINTQTALHPNKAGGSRQALTNAGKQAGLAIAPKLLAEWKGQPGTAQGEMYINLTGADVLPHLPAFRTVLKNIRGVTRHQPIEMAPGQATIKVSFDGTPQALADALVLESFDAFAINIAEIRDNQIQIELTAQ